MALRTLTLRDHSRSLVAVVAAGEDRQDTKAPVLTVRHTAKTAIPHVHHAKPARDIQCRVCKPEAVTHGRCRRVSRARGSARLDAVFRSERGADVDFEGLNPRGQMAVRLPMRMSWGAGRRRRSSGLRGRCCQVSVGAMARPPPSRGRGLPTPLSCMALGAPEAMGSGARMGCAPDMRTSCRARHDASLP